MWDVIRRCVRTWADEVHSQVCTSSEVGGQRTRRPGAPEVAVKASPAPSLQKGGSQPTSSEACALQVDSL